MNVWLPIAAINGALAVVFGAFAAHGLKGRLDSHAIELFETGARYHMYHALAMGLSAFAVRGASRSPAQLAAILFLAGIILFSGSLYLLALTGTRGFAIVTPIGGLCFIAGWAVLVFAGMRLSP